MPGVYLSSLQSRNYVKQSLCDYHAYIPIHHAFFSSTDFSEPLFAFELLASRRSMAKSFTACSQAALSTTLSVVNLLFSSDGLCWTVTKINAALLQRGNDTYTKKWMRGLKSATLFILLLSNYFIFLISLLTPCLQDRIFQHSKNKHAQLYNCIYTNIFITEDFIFF